MGGRRRTFAETLREKRLAKGLSLRKFAGLVGISPTYLSQVEQGRISPPTAERVTKMAQLLGEDPDELVALAGRLPGDLTGLILRQPTHLPELLREASGLSAEQLHRLTEEARRLKGRGGR